MTKLHCWAGAALAALTLAACGGGDSTTDSDATDANSADRLTASQFVAAVEDDKRAYIEKVMAGVPECAGYKIHRSFLLFISSRATELPPDQPIDDEIYSVCDP